MYTWLYKETDFIISRYLLVYRTLLDLLVNYQSGHTAGWKRMIAESVFMDLLVCKQLKCTHDGLKQTVYSVFISLHHCKWLMYIKCPIKVYTLFEGDLFHYLYFLLANDSSVSTKVWRRWMFAPDWAVTALRDDWRWHTHQGSLG